MIEIIPAIDIIDGKCVRLTQGDFDRMKVYGDPLDMARMFEDHGLTRLHLVDLDGARAQQVVNYRIVEKIASKTALEIDAGGGIRTDEDVRILFQSGARMVTGGSIAVREQEMFLNWLSVYGPDRIILGADFREDKIAISGWHEETSVVLREFIARYHEQGIRKVICTDIERDGMLEGPSVDTYKKIKEEVQDLYLIASGGIGSMKDIEELDRGVTDGVILGKAIYEERITMQDLESYILQNR
jgi:phosphoribosylformimino-5-aminoimidazole carboxamide ribotide isomerase